MQTERGVQARSLVTRAKLIEAALDEIHAAGIRAASTEAIARRAGMSRGAMLHHFPAREDIVVAAMEHLLRSGTAEIRARAEAVKLGQTTLDGLIDFFWSLYSGRFYHLSLELVVEARCNPGFNVRMRPVLKEFHQALDAVWLTMSQSRSATAPRSVVALNLTLCLMRGMGFQTILRSDPQYYQEMLALWKEILPAILEDGPPADGPLPD